MPSRQPPSPSPLSLPHNHHHHRHHHTLIPSLVTATVSFSLLLLFAFFYRKLSRPRTVPEDDRDPTPPSPQPRRRFWCFPFSLLKRRTTPLSDDKQPPLSSTTLPELRRFPLSLLRKATSSFSPSNRLGQGGFGSVYRGVIPVTGERVAVKLMESAGTIQGEREFQNELTLAGKVLSSAVGGRCKFLVSVIGYCGGSGGGGGGGGERKAIVYELMGNGSLQEKLLDKKCEELNVWRKRFDIVCDVARGLEFLHLRCGESAVVHGDVKPSNVLLDEEFCAKLGDFGLARVVDVEEREIVEGKGGGEEVEGEVEVEGDLGSVVEESESVVTVERSPVSPSDGFERASSLPESWVDKMSVESGANNNFNGDGNGGKKKRGGGLGRESWWWKQDNGGGGAGEGGRVKDYVMEWIGSEIKKERPNSCDLVGGCGSSTSTPQGNDGDGDGEGGKGEVKKVKKKEKKKRWEWWVSLDEDVLGRKKEKGSRKPREWWREEFCEELSKKKNKKGGKSTGGVTELWWQRDEEDFVAPERKKRRKSKSSFGSIDWWLDGLSGELRNGRRNSQDWGCGDVPKSGGISSTPSMRGTVCYIAPEYGGGGQLSEKCDVYSFGVLILVIVSGRRPLQVLASPMSEFERANLVSWARQLASNGKLFDLIDTSIQSLDKDQAMLCITIALLCIQRSPSKRPNMKEIVEMLTGEAEPPHLPFEFSPSPPSNFPFKSRKKGR